jgi:hypothetical protein
MAQEPPVGQGLIIIVASRSRRLDTPHSVGLLWTNDQPEAETPTDNKQQSQATDIQAPAGFKPTIPASEQPQTHDLDLEAIGIGSRKRIHFHKSVHKN